MKRILLIAFLLLQAVAMKAQSDELNRLADIVKSLRGGGEAAFTKAVEQLKTDRRWTPMDELGIDRAVECKVSDRVPGFRLNSVLTNAENAQRYQATTGNYLNGTDSRFNYSLFEKTIKAGKTAHFSLAGRWGDQVFIVMPYAADAGIAVSIESGGAAFSQSPLGNGAVRLTGKAVKGRAVNISICNESDTAVSYVILNYNSRR